MRKKENARGNEVSFLSLGALYSLSLSLSLIYEILALTGVVVGDGGLVEGGGTSVGLGPGGGGEGGGGGLVMC